MIRLSKMVLVAAVAAYCIVTAMANIIDYHAHFPAVERAMSMQEVFPTVTISYRAVTNTHLHHAAYVTIIVLESLTGLLCAIGVWQLLRVRKEKAVVFNRQKRWAVAGLTLGFLTWQFLFMTIGGEWFGMWMSPVLNGALTTSFQIFVTILLVLIYLVSKDE